MDGADLWCADNDEGERERVKAYSSSSARATASGTDEVGADMGEGDRDQWDSDGLGMRVERREGGDFNDRRAGVIAVAWFSTSIPGG